MKRIVVHFLNEDGTSFRESLVAEYDASGTAAEAFEEFWAIDKARGDLAGVQMEYPSGATDQGPPEVDRPWMPTPYASAPNDSRRST